MQRESSLINLGFYASVLDWIIGSKERRGVLLILTSAALATLANGVHRKLIRSWEMGVFDEAPIASINNTLNGVITLHLSTGHTIHICNPEYGLPEKYPEKLIMHDLEINALTVADAAMAIKGWALVER